MCIHGVYLGNFHIKRVGGLSDYKVNASNSDLAIANNVCDLMN